MSLVSVKVRRERNKVLIEFATEKDYEAFRKSISEANELVKQMALSNNGRFFDTEGKEIEKLQNVKKKEGDESA